MWGRAAAAVKPAAPLDGKEESDGKTALSSILRKYRP
jgi:hypothetical protein